MVIASHSSNSFSVLFIFSLIVGGLSLPSAILIGISFPSATPLFVRMSNRILLPLTTSPACFPSCASSPLLVSPTRANQYKPRNNALKAARHQLTRSSLLINLHPLLRLHRRSLIQEPRPKVPRFRNRHRNSERRQFLRERLAQTRYRPFRRVIPITRIKKSAFTLSFSHALYENKQGTQLTTPPPRPPSTTQYSQNYTPPCPRFPPSNTATPPSSRSTSPTHSC